MNTKNVLFITIIPIFLIITVVLGAYKILSGLASVALFLVIVGVSLSTLKNLNKESYTKREEEEYLERNRRDQEARSLGGVPYLLM